MSKFTDALKHIPGAGLVVEIDEEAPAAVKPTAPAPPSAHPAFSAPIPTSFAAAPAPASSPFAVPSTVVLDDAVYQSVLKKTNFDDTPVGKAIHKYYDALDVIPDQTARFRAAIAQATKLDGITADAVLKTFDDLQAALDRDANGFAGVAATVEKNQITTRQDQIAAKQAQITQLNQEIATLSAELADQQATHSNAVTQYGLAQQKRTQEIAAQKSQFAALLH